MGVIPLLFLLWCIWEIFHKEENLNTRLERKRGAIRQNAKLPLYILKS